MVVCLLATTRAVALGSTLPLALATRTTVAKTAMAGLFEAVFSRHMAFAARRQRHDAHRHAR